MTHPANALASSASSYLRSAMHQPVAWHEWGPEAFARAADENKPILLDIGAVWCHWCHVMDRESYEDPVLARVINEHFVAVKVDRDERPDVDSRYQAAVSAISGQGGWPLTAVLTPEGKPFFGGTYFPREERYGQPGFERILLTMADVWQSRRDEAVESAASVLEAIESNENFAGQSGALTLGIVDAMVASAVGQFDQRFGGFGSQPKFPHPAAIDLLLDVAVRPRPAQAELAGAAGNEAARQAAIVTLERMARGGVYDQLGGGFHRYSVDDRWVVPHFEKMLYDNSELLRNYVHAFQSFAIPAMAAVAKDILRWMDEGLSDREQGGFYASQDADINLDDDGDYFTWTREEAAEVLSADELRVAGDYYDIGELGDMHHNPKKNVLHVTQTLDAVAKRAGMPLEQAQKLLASARAKLYTARGKRPTPFVDRTIYTGWNAMGVSAYFEAAHALRLPKTREFALLTLDRLLAEGWDEELGVAHVIAYADGAPGRRIAGLLDDYAFLVHACLDGWLATGAIKYYRSAVKVAERMIADFYDHAGGAFFDAPSIARREGQTLGALSATRKPLQDAPTPAGNSAAAAALLRLEALSGRTDFRDKAQETLEAFAGVAEKFGFYASTYGLALERFLLPPLQVVVVGKLSADDERAEALDLAAMAPFAVNKSVIRLSPVQIAGELPPALAETLPRLPQLAGDASFAVVCKGMSCLPPVTEVEELRRQLRDGFTGGETLIPRALFPSRRS